MKAWGDSLLRSATAMLRLPEFTVLLFAFLLNYPWEFIQAPLFEGMADAPHWDAVKTCTRAALGDAVILLTAYWIVAGLGRGRAWPLRAAGPDLVLLVAAGTGITTLIEVLALNGWWITQWRYSAAMPVLPALGVGLVPLLQWVVLPPLVVVLVRGQLRAAEASR